MSRPADEQAAYEAAVREKATTLPPITQEETRDQLSLLLRGRRSEQAPDSTRRVS